MSLRTFILGLSASFGVAWLSIIVVPYFKMRNLAPIPDAEAEKTSAGVFYPKRTGRVANGARVYAENGCYQCHSQVVRPTYAGNDMFRPDWGGLQSDPDRGDTRRETNAYDFAGEKFAQIGVMRIGPDLSNVGTRVSIAYLTNKEDKQTPASWKTSPETWLYEHLYNPRNNPKLWKSTCPPHPFLFEKRPVKGNPGADALKVDAGAGYELVPGPDARALISYLLSLKKDQKAPTALDFAPKKKSGDG